MPVKIHRHVGEITGAVARLAKKALPGLPSLKFRVLRSTLLSVRRVVGYFQEPSFLESDWRTTASIGQIHLACRQDQETGRSILPNDRLCRRSKGSSDGESVSQSVTRPAIVEDGVRGHQSVCRAAAGGEHRRRRRRWRRRGRWRCRRHHRARVRRGGRHRGGHPGP